MTDNEVIFAFVNGCELLKNDDVRMEDMHEIRKCLDRCAESLLPYVHRYVTKKECKSCKRNKSKKSSYIDCKYRALCECSTDRKYYER